MDIESQAEAAEKALQELRRELQAASAPVRNPKADKAVECQRQLAACERASQRVRHALDSYKLEVKALSPEQHGTHNRRLQSLEDGLKECRAQIDWKKCENARQNADVTGASGSVASSLNFDEESGPLSLEQVQGMADRTQNESVESLARSKRMVLEAEQVGVSTLARMHEQEEQLNRIGEDVEDIKANIKRSKKLVAQIARGAASDRCIQVLCLLVTIAILVMITLAIIGKDGGQLNVPSQVRQQRRLRGGSAWAS